jgi:hypothetical protein
LLLPQLNFSSSSFFCLCSDSWMFVCWLPACNPPINLFFFVFLFA